MKSLQKDRLRKELKFHYTISSVLMFVGVSCLLGSALIDPLKAPYLVYGALTLFGIKLSIQIGVMLTTERVRLYYRYALAPTSNRILTAAMIGVLLPQMHIGEMLILAIVTLIVTVIEMDMAWLGEPLLDYRIKDKPLLLVWERRCMLVSVIDGWVKLGNWNPRVSNFDASVRDELIKLNKQLVSERLPTFINKRIRYTQGL